VSDKKDCIKYSMENLGPGSRSNNLMSEYPDQGTENQTAKHVDGIVKTDKDPEEQERNGDSQKNRRGGKVILENKEEKVDGFNGMAGGKRAGFIPAVDQPLRGGIVALEKRAGPNSVSFADFLNNFSDYSG
jgi:hypothetical protein